MHSAERTLSEQKVRSPRATSQLCAAEVARIIGVAMLSASAVSSVRTMWPAPARTASSASCRTRISDWRRVPGPLSAGNTQWITR